MREPMSSISLHAARSELQAADRGRRHRVWRRRAAARRRPVTEPIAAQTRRATGSAREQPEVLKLKSVRFRLYDSWPCLQNGWRLLKALWIFQLNPALTVNFGRLASPS